MLLRVMDLLVSRDHLRLDVGVAASVVVSVVIGKIAAAYVEANPVAFQKRVSDRIHFDRELRYFARIEQPRVSQPFLYLARTMP